MMIHIKKAFELKDQLDKLRPLVPEIEARIMQKLRLDWNFHSNNLEGNSLTQGETKSLLLYGLTAQGKPLKDHFEIEGHDKAIKWIEEVAKGDFPITEIFIRQLHQLILKENYWSKAQTIDGKESQILVEVGKYKTQPNHVKTITGEMFYFAEPVDVPLKMQNLLEWLRKKELEKDFNPIILAAEFHYKFIIIHPFSDGNGRLARILMNLILMKFGYPPIIVKTQDKNNYFAALSQVDVGEIEVFIEYIAKNLVNSLELMIKGANGESIEEPTDFDKKLDLLERKLKAGKKVEITRSEKAISEIFNDSITRFYKKFIIEFEKFDRFYEKSSFSSSIRSSNESIDVNDKKNFLNEALNFTKNRELSEIEIIYTFKFLKYDSVVNSNSAAFYAAFYIEFLQDKYILNDFLKTLIAKKPYGQQMTDEEIDKIIKTESEKHLKFIETQLNQSNK